MVEAQGASTKKDFTNFLNYALKSANESRYWLALLRDSVKEPNNAKTILKEAQEISRILGSTIKKLKPKL